MSAVTAIGEADRDQDEWQRAFRDESFHAELLNDFDRLRTLRYAATVRDEQRDEVADLGSATVEALVSLVPGIGGVLAVFTNQMLGSAFERRTVRLLKELRDDLDRLDRAGRMRPPEDGESADQFQGGVHRTIRQLLESGSEEKRRLLRNALLNRTAGFEDPGRFDRVLDQCEPDDVRVLRAVRELLVGRDRMLDHTTDAVRRYYDAAHEPIPSRLFQRVRFLADEGLLSHNASNVVHEQTVRDRYGRRTPQQVVKTEDFHGVSSYGDGFLAYVADPFDESSPA